MIKVISFDIDDTLIDEKTDFIIWNVEIPKLYAKTNEIDIKEAERIVFSEYYRAGYIDKTLRWTDIKYWFDRLKLDGWEKILDDVKGDIKPYDDSKEILLHLKEKYKVITTTLNTWEFLEMKLTSTGLIDFFDNHFYSGITTVDKRGITKNDLSLFKHVIKEMGVKAEEIVHVGDSQLADFDIPSSLGIKCYLLDRSGEKAGEGVIHSLSELKKIL